MGLINSFNNSSIYVDIKWKKLVTGEGFEPTTI